jgi:hypothetical protein
MPHLLVIVGSGQWCSGMVGGIIGISGISRISCALCRISRVCGTCGICGLGIRLISGFCGLVGSVKLTKYLSSRLPFLCEVTYILPIARWGPSDRF